ncbi:2-hydroxyacid dehydrogenase [Roseovarius sp.]|uniref:2-hydroxyacid dehydrogenase n=1 Tax=Roseovarius sp. TaxID=1486281 RepID=UPI003A988600
MALLFLSSPERAAVWAPIFEAAGEEMEIGEAAVSDPSAITHILCWQPPKDISRYPNLRVLISSGAGVDQMPTLPEGVQLSRTVAKGIEEMVRDWVVMAALMLHRNMPIYLAQAARGDWRAHMTRGTGFTRVGVMGLGRIGKLAARTLADLGFQVAGWSRSGARVEGIETFGEADLEAFLGRTDLLVCLLPLTPRTQGLMDAAFLARLPRGAMLAHAGRGAQLDMTALRHALDEGQISAAMLDVTDPEPLPQDHWAWGDPRVIVTPHIASETDHAEGAAHALNVIRATREGREIPGLVDPLRGY